MRFWNRKLIAISIEASKLVAIRIAGFREKRKTNVYRPLRKSPLHSADFQLLELELGTWMLDAVPTTHFREKGAIRSEKKAYRHARSNAFTIMSDATHSTLIIVDDLPRIGNENRAHLRELDRMAIPVKEPNAQLLFKASDMIAKNRLGNEKVLRGFGIVERRRKQEKFVQSIDFHRFAPLSLCLSLYTSETND